MSTDNFVDEVETVESVNEPVDAENTEKKVRGRPITKENARAYQMSSTQAKRARREARHKMLAALTHDLDLGEELRKAMLQKDEQYLSMIIAASKLTGLEWSQSDEGRIQNLNIKSDATVKTDGAIKFVIEEASDAKNS
jgi:hypothetical protein